MLIFTLGFLTYFRCEFQLFTVISEIMLNKFRQRKLFILCQWKNRTNFFQKLPLKRGRALSEKTKLAFSLGS